MRNNHPVNALWRLDFAEPRLILPPMLRKLIALVVLVTGLAALGQPAQARIVDLDSIGLASLDTGPAHTAQARVAATRFVATAERDQAPQKSCTKPPRVVVLVPTVMLQADRARE